MEQPEHKTKELARLETFSDGVFAIAITLLILEVIQTLHSGSRVPLRHLLLTNWKSILVFLIGFLTILICWINHHVVLTYAEKTDGNFFWVNGFVLLVVTFTPFPTAILAEYLESESSLALAIFGFNYFMMSLSAYVFTAYIQRKLATKEGKDLLNYYKVLYKYSAIYTFVVIFICLVSVPVAMFLYFVLFIPFAFPKEVALRLSGRKYKKKRRSAAHVSAP
jgi:TMEM175 potassium channel family protein